MNVPNAALDMTDYIIRDCYSYDSDEHTRAHGFMITDDDLLLDILIMNCIFNNNEAQNGGAGLYIDRVEKYVYISNCQFLMSKATYNEGAENYGANLQVHNGCMVSISDTKFYFEKTNEALNTFFEGLDQIMSNCCFKSTGSAVEDSPFHIKSGTAINFMRFSCFNNQKDNNFKLPSDQSTNYISFNCEDFCTPLNECPTSRKESYGANMVLYKCNFNNFNDAKTNTQGGVIRLTGGIITCDTCSFTASKLTGTGYHAAVLSTLISHSRQQATVNSSDANQIELAEVLILKCQAVENSVTMYFHTAYQLEHQHSKSIMPHLETIHNQKFIQLKLNYVLSRIAAIMQLKMMTIIAHLRLISMVQLRLSMEHLTTVSLPILKDLEFYLNAHTSLTNIIFQNIVNDQQNHCSCVHCLVRSISKGKYVLRNATFLDCVTEDFGVFNMPNVEIDMQDCQVLKCISKDSDRHVDAHGFMITDDDYLIAQNKIINCVFEAKKAANGGAGLYIDRSDVFLTVTNFKFIRNKVTYAANSKNYGTNVHIVSQNSYIHLDLCKFTTDKENDASSVLFVGIGNLYMRSSCFITKGDGFKYAYHITSTATNWFEGANCFNDMGEYNFNFTYKEKSNVTFSYECADNCMPYSYCPIMARYPNSTDTTLILVHCDFISFSVSSENGKHGGALYCSTCKVYITSYTFQSCSAMETDGQGSAVYLKTSNTLEVADGKFTSC